MQYTIIVQVSLQGLQREVNLALSQGWRPLGGIAVVPGEYFAQALVHDDPMAPVPAMFQHTR